MGTASPAAGPASVALLLRAAVLLLAVLGGPPGAALLPQAEAAGAASTAVLGWSPGVARGVPVQAPITIYFNRPMDRASVTRAWTLTPTVPGRLTWGGA